MGYYAGGYYAGGNYYSGGLFSAIGGALHGLVKGVGTVLKTGVKVAGGAIAGLPMGPAGVIAGGLGGAISAGQANAAADINQALAAGPTALTPDLIAKHNSALARGGAGGGTLKPNTALPMVQPGASIAPPGGMGPMGSGGGVMMTTLPFHRIHPNKSTYITRGGGTSRWPVGIMVHPKGTEPVASRRMNVANPRALRRALRRAHGFAKLARRYITVTKHFKRGKRVRRR